MLMWQKLKKLDSILNQIDWRQLKFMLSLVVVGTLLESISVLSILPFMQLATSPETCDSGQWHWLKNALGFTSSQNFTIALGLVVLVMYAITSVSNVLTKWLTYRTIWNVSQRLEVNLLHQYMRLPFEHIQQQNSAELVKKAVADIQQLVTGVLLSGCLFLANSFKALLLLAMLFYADPVLSLISCAVYGTAYLLIHLACHRYLKRLGEKRVETTALRFQTFFEALTGAQTLRVAGANHFFASRFERSLSS